MNRWIVVSNGIPQREIVGKTELDDLEFQDIVDEDCVVKLEEARYLQTMHVPTPQGLAQSIQCVPIGLNRGPITLYTSVTSYYDPQQEEAGYKELLKQIEICAKNEAAHRAHDAGLTIPTNIRQRPSGKLVQ